MKLVIELARSYVQRSNELASDLNISVNCCDIIKIGVLILSSRARNAIIFISQAYVFLTWRCLFN